MLCLYVFTEKLKQSGGVYSDEQVARCSELGGQFAKTLESLFCTRVGTEKCQYFCNHKHVERRDVEVFVNTYKCDNLWGNIPKRSHAGFEKVKHEWRIRDCKRFATKLSNLSARLDMWKTFV